MGDGEGGPCRLLGMSAAGSEGRGAIEGREGSQGDSGRRERVPMCVLFFFLFPHPALTLVPSRGSEVLGRVRHATE